MRQAGASSQKVVRQGGAYNLRHVNLHVPRTKKNLAKRPWIAMLTIMLTRGYQGMISHAKVIQGYRRIKCQGPQHLVPQHQEAPM